jgi:cytochrome P450
MSMMMWMLGQHPEVERKLHEEVDSVLQGHAPTLDDVVKLKYLKNVVRETQRLWPIVPWVDRMAKHVRSFRDSSTQRIHRNLMCHCRMLKLLGTKSLLEPVWL